MGRQHDRLFHFPLRERAVQPLQLLPSRWIQRRAGFHGHGRHHADYRWLQEFKVQSHNDSSSYGGALGGIVNVATKAGTNEYHGDVWEFLRNNALDARNFFIADTIPYKQNQFGGVIGGPLLPGRFRSGAPKSRFYASYEGYRSVRSSQSLLNVPTPAEMTGDLSALTKTQIFNPGTTRPDPANPGSYLRDPF